MNQKAKQEVVSTLKERLLEPTKEQLRFMHEKAVRHEIYYSSPKRLWCTNCGHRFSIGRELKNDYKEMETCPRCGMRLHTCKTNKMTCNEDGYAMIADTIGDWQILRYFYLENHNYIDGYTFSSRAKVTYAPSKDCTEVLRIWLNVNTKDTITESLPLCSFPNWRRQPYQLYDSWNKVYPSLRICSAYQEKSEWRIEWMLKKVCPKPNIHPYFRKRGINARNINDLWTDTYMRNVDSHPYAETLLKMGQIRLANQFVGGNCDAIRYERQIRIALRHGFNFEKMKGSLRDYWDYLRQLRELGRDDTNPENLVPYNFAMAHQYLTDLLQEKHERERQREAEEYKAKQISERMKKLEQDEKDYLARMSKFFSLAIVTKSGITITPLKSVQAFYEEGEAMHHCVYSCGYYAKEDSLVLSARSADGKRVETIEVDLSTMKVLQSRGVCNKPTDSHKEILNAMERNMWQIEEIANDKRMKVAC